jgi:hypothetical protein
MPLALRIVLRLMPPALRIVSRLVPHALRIVLRLMSPALHILLRLVPHESYRVVHVMINRSFTAPAQNPSLRTVNTHFTKFRNLILFKYLFLAADSRG